MADYKVDIDVVVNDEKLDALERTINEIKNKNVEISIDTKSANTKVDALKRKIESLANIKFNIDGFGGASTSMKNIREQAKSTVDTFNRLLALQGKMNKRANTMGGLSGNDLINAKSDMRELEAEYNRLYATVAKKLNTDQIRQLNNAAGSSLPAVKQTINAWNELKRVTKDVGTLSTKLAKLDGNVNADKVGELTRQFKDAKSASEELRNSLKGQLSLGQYEQLNSELVKTENKIKEIEAGITDAKRNLANKTSKGLDTGGDITKSYNDIERSFRSITEASNDAVSAIERVERAKQQLDSVNAGKKSFSTMEEEVAYYDKLIAAEKEYQDSVKSANNIIHENIAAEKESASQAKASAAATKERAKAISDASKRELEARNLQQKIANLSLDMQIYKKNNSKIKDTVYGDELNSLIKGLRNCDRVKFDNINGQFSILKKNIELAGKTGLNFPDRLKMQFNRLSAYFGASGVIMTAIQATRKMFENVKEVDSAMTELKRVTDLSATQYSDIYNSLTESAREYGTTLSDIINATADWSRAGFDANIAKGLAEVTTMYQHIADVDYDTAFENLETAYKGFEDQLKKDFGGDTVSAVGYIGDVLNELDNNFAVTADGVGQALKRSASALSIAGNTIQETAGMVTGITEVTQDPEKAGNALKVLSMRLRGMKGDLEDLGEDVDENVENLSKMQGQVLNLTHGHVNIFDDAGEFKSTYEIMQGIAEIYDELSSTEQADLLETIAGKHRANDVAALIGNWEQVASATEHATEATGSAAREHEKYLDSIEGRMNALTSVWQTFSGTVMNSNFVKFIVSSASELLNVLEKIISTIGSFGTAGLIGAVFFGAKKGSVVNTMATDFIQRFGFALDSTGKKAEAFRYSFKGLWGDIKSFVMPKNMEDGSRHLNVSGLLSVAGIGITVLSSAVEMYQSYLKEIEQKRQEAIDASNSFGDSFDTFEQAYIKYSDKNILTADEESELTSAINGTISALGDKSAALREAAGASSEYSQNLDEIAKAELKQAQGLSNEGKSKAKERLLSNYFAGDNPGDLTFADSMLRPLNFLFGTSWGWKASNADFKLGSYGSKEYEAIKDIVENDAFKEYLDTGSEWGKLNYYFRYDPKANGLDGYIKQLNMAQSVVDRLNETATKTGDESYLDSEVYKTATESVDNMSSAINDYIQQTYAAEKATYQLNNGIPKTIDEFYKMQDAVLSASSSSVEGRAAIANLMSEEYKSVFDLSSTEAQVRQLQALTKDIDGIGDEKEKTFETFIDFKTKVNNGDCSVGDYAKAVEEANDAINEIAKTNPGAANALRIQLGIEIDSDGNIDDEVIKLREKLIKQLTDNNVNKTVAKKFVDGLSNTELNAAVDLVTSGEIDLGDLDTTNLDASLKKKIQDHAKYLEAMRYTINVDAEAEGFEKLNSAMAESRTATGLTSESMQALEDRYKSLEGYDAAKLFQETANGISLNSEAVNEYEKTLATNKLDETNKNIGALKDKYYDLTSQIQNCSDATKRAELINEQENVREKITELAELATMYEGLTSSYNEWQNAESAGNNRDMYESIYSAQENIKKELDNGWIDDGTREYFQLIWGEDKWSGAGKSVQDYRDQWAKLDETISGTSYSISDFFKTNEDGELTSEGIFNFFDAIGEKQKELGTDWIQYDENGDMKSFNFGIDGDKAIADAMGISEELVQIFLRASQDAGFVVNFDGTYTQLADMQSQADAAAARLKDIGMTNVDFDFNTKDISSLNSQLEEARKILADPSFWNQDGTFNFDIEGAAEAMQVVSTLQATIDNLGNHYIGLTVEDDSFKEPLEKLQDYENKVAYLNQLKLDPEANAEDIEKLEADIQDIVQYVRDHAEDLKLEITPETTDEDIANMIESGEIEIPTTLDIQTNMSETLDDLKDIMLLNSGYLTDDQALELKVKLGIATDDEQIENEKKKAKKSAEEIIESVESSLSGENITLSKTGKDRATKFFENNEYARGFDKDEQTRTVKFIADWSDIDEGKNKYTDDQIKAVVEFVKDSDAVDEYVNDPIKKQAIIDFVVENQNILDELDLSKEQKDIVIDFAANNPGILDELDDEEKKIAVDFIVKNPDFLDNLGLNGDEKKVAIDFIVKNQDFFNGLSKEEQQIAVTYVAKNPDFFNGLDDAQKQVAVKFVADTDIIDNYTPEEQTAIVNFVKDSKDIDNYTPEQKQAIAKYAVDGGDVDQYSPEDRQAIVDFLTNSADPDSYTPEQKEAIAKFLKDSGEVDGYQPGQKEAIARFSKDSTEPDNYQPPAKTQNVTANLDSSNVDNYNPPDKQMTVWASIKKVASDLWSSLTGGGSDVDGTAHVNGTAFANGTTGKAFKQGNWGTKEDGVALGGELGEELLVRNGRWYTIGENGAEFFGYKKDDIIFNADQTRELFEKGKITHGNGRGKALASGTAFSNGTGSKRPSYESSSSSSSSGSSSSSSSSSDAADEFEETLDWIEVIINRIERAISKLDKTATSTYKNWTKRGTALNEQIAKTREEIDLQQRAYDRYVQQADSVGLDENYASKVRNGEINIETIDNEDLNDKISEYKEW